MIVKNSFEQEKKLKQIEKEPKEKPQINLNQKLIKNFSMGDQRNQNHRDNLFRVAYFDISLQGWDKVDIYVKHRSLGAMEILWHEMSVANFKKHYANQKTVYAFVLGATLVFVIFSIFFYASLKNVFYVIYPLFIIISALYQLTLAGFMYEAGLHPAINTLFSFFLPSLGIWLIGYFPIYFYNLNANHKFRRLREATKLFSWLMILLGLITTLYVFNDKVAYIFTLLNFVALVVMSLVTIIAFRMYQIKESGSTYYLLSNVIFLLSLFYFTSASVGIVPADNFWYYSISLGTFFQIVFIGMALAQKTIKIRNENLVYNNLLYEYSKLTFIGQTFINIYHQWKMPLNNISNCIAHVETARDFNDPALHCIYDKNIKEIKENISYINSTTSNYLHYYSNTYQEKSTFKVFEEINFVVGFIDNELSLRAITIRVKCDKMLKLTTYKNFFDNVLMIILENAIRVFERRKIKHPVLDISAFASEGTFCLEIKDNGGGIKHHPIQKIFDKEVSDNSTGIGLYLAKNILAEKLGGEIIAKNSNNGSIFTLTIPL
jgi:hypothetical protein